MKARQTSMFQTEDLPLFSGTPQRAQASTFIPQQAATQLSLADCHICGDTGYFDGGSFCCWCDAGTRAREIRYGQLPTTKLRQDGYTHFVKHAPGVVFVYRPAPSYPDKWGQKVVLYHSDPGDEYNGHWITDEPSILVETLPEEVIQL